jgi:hypothetical protein
MSKKANSTIPFDTTPIEGGGFHFFVSVVIEGKRARFLIDTGASKTVIHKAYYEKKLRRKLKVIAQETTGLHSTVLESYTGAIKQLSIGAWQIHSYEIAAVDLNHVNTMYQKMGLPAIDGILGADILHHAAASINFKRGLITLAQYEYLPLPQF